VLTKGPSDVVDDGRDHGIGIVRLTFGRGLEITSRKNDLIASTASVRIPM
jgi:hypothetical protein